MLSFVFMAVSILFNRNILYCKEIIRSNNRWCYLDLIGTFCIVKLWIIVTNFAGIKFNRNILYCKGFFNTFQHLFSIDLIGTFCIVKGYARHLDRDRDGFNRNILYCKGQKKWLRKYYIFLFNRNILYCKQHYNRSIWSVKI